MCVDRILDVVIFVLRILVVVILESAEFDTTKLSVEMEEMDAYDEFV